MAFLKIEKKKKNNNPHPNTHAHISCIKLIEPNRERHFVHKIFCRVKNELLLICVPNILCISIAYFHPNWSKGTAAVRGTQAINSCRHYWEIHVSHRVFGTRYAAHTHTVIYVEFYFKAFFNFLFLSIAQYDVWNWNGRCSFACK